MVFQHIGLYNHPEDKAAFDAHYDNVHGPLTKAMPGVRRVDVMHPGAGIDGSEPPYYMVVMVTFDSEEAADAAVASPQGEAAIADIPNIAKAGCTVLAGTTVKKY